MALGLRSPHTYRVEWTPGHQSGLLRSHSTTPARLGDRANPSSRGIAVTARTSTGATASASAGSPSRVTCNVPADATSIATTRLTACHSTQRHVHFSRPRWRPRHKLTQPPSSRRKPADSPKRDTRTTGPHVQVDRACAQVG